MIIGVDPGTTKSAVVLLRNLDRPPRLLDHALLDNHTVMPWIQGFSVTGNILVIEKIASFGMPVGAEVFETVFWSGRFAEAWGGEWHRITRNEVKNHICHSSRAKDSNIRQAIIDRFGGLAAIGRKSAPGPLYGIAGDEWSALAVALTYADNPPAVNESAVPF